MRILFSPIGTADPLTTLGDGPMLHIVRHYKPERIVLFLSPSMAKYQKADGRYIDAIKRLCELDGRSEPTVELIESKRADVQRFDAYINDFEDHLKKLRKQNKKAEILVNVSSGTPAMEQALVALGAFGEYDLKLLQVSTPRHGMNRGDDRENPDNFDLDTLWELNPDNSEDASPSRIEEVNLPNFRDRLLRQNITALIYAYDYDAALILAKQTETVSAQVVNSIRGASNRLNLTKRVSNNDARLAEYLWVLEVRKNQCHWADFVRSLTPAYTWTAKHVLERNGLPTTAYLKDNDEDVIDPIKVYRDGSLSRILGSALARGAEPHFLTNAQLANLVQAYCRPDDASKMKMIREFEKGSRNKLAHEIAPAQKELIEQRGGATFDEVMDALFLLNGVRPGKYDEINRQIVSLL